MEEKKGSMGHCREAGCNCGGTCGDHWMSQTEYTIVRNLLLFMFILFVFWTGLTLGELRAYLKANNNFGYPINDSMMGWYGERDINPSMMRQGSTRYTATPSSSPLPNRKGGY